MDKDLIDQKFSYYNLPDTHLQKTLQDLKSSDLIRRIWQRDHTVWAKNSEEAGNRLGWLDSHEKMLKEIQPMVSLASKIKSEGFQHALLLGMGGSSMAPEVFRKIFGVKTGYPDLQILDSTNPGAVLQVERAIDLQHTLFIVSTKSGGTVETISLMTYFFNKVARLTGDDAAGRHFIAITDPGSNLEIIAEKLAFRKTLLNNPDIGGRYSALSYFGIAPAALIGVDLDLLLGSAKKMADYAKETDYPPEGGNSSLLLGAALGVLGNMGRDKITLISSPPIMPFGAWLEQLLAESTGKEGKGLLPVVGETVTEPEAYGKDRLFIHFDFDGIEADNRYIDKLIVAGHPLFRFRLTNRYDIGGELFRWMMATAIAGQLLGINPFDQPNVESAKILAKNMVAAYQEEGTLPVTEPDYKRAGIEVFFGRRVTGLKQAWQEFLSKVKSGKNEGKGRSYIAIQAYLKPCPETDEALQKLRDKLHLTTRLAVTVGYGPRFLHSTGQLHKGDAGNGLFVQLTEGISEDIAIPDHPGSENSKISFGILKSAQALGDRQALLDAGRAVIRFHFDEDSAEAIERLRQSL